jgi:hypothetical protein
VGALFLAVNSGAQTVDVPIVVPLHFTQITSGTHKLGIYVRFKTTSVVDAGNVGIQNKEEDLDYFMNTGISLFYAYDMIYNLKDGEIGLLEVPVIGETRVISETDLEACIRLGSNQRFFEKNRVLGRFGDLLFFTRSLTAIRLAPGGADRN